MTAPTALRHGKRILVVDDSEVIQEVLKEFLRPHYTVQTVGNAALALTAVIQNKPDAILIDVRMPGIDGISAMREIKQDPHTVDIPVVILTAYHPIRTIKGGALETAARFMMKPCAPEELEQHVCSVLDTRRSDDAPGTA